MSLRSMAMARVLMGFVLLGDYVWRWQYCREFYTREGFCGQALLFETLTSYLLPSLQLANDTVLYQNLLMALGVALAGAVLLGYRTRVTTALSWFLLVGLHERNPLVQNSGDTLLVALLFWGIFLPWGEVWSLDQQRTGGAASSAPGPWLSAATVGWGLQMSALYLFAALHKLHPFWWSEGSAVQYALSLGPHATAWAEPLLQFPTLLPFLTRFVWVSELALSLVILAPWPKFRRVVLVAAALMHLLFGLFLEIGIFRYVPLIGLLALVPDIPFQARAVQVRLEPVRSSILLSLCLMTLAVNFESLGRGREVVLRAPVLRVVSGLTGLQNFGVFAGPGLEHDSWTAIEVVAQDGESYDAWGGDGRWTRERPQLVSSTYPDDRWRKFLMNLPALPLESPYRRAFADWSREEWNKRHPENPARQVRVWQAQAQTRLTGAPAKPEWILVAEVGS